MTAAAPHPNLMRCDDARDLPSFMHHVLSVIVSGQPFAWWVEDADRSLRLAFVIRIDRGAFRVADHAFVDHGVFSDFAAAIRHGVTKSERPQDGVQDGQRSRCAL